MSRVSRKSELSPSITRGSSGIDLGKNSGVDMGRKSEPSLTSGGIGITQEITNVGGMSVSGGIEVDLTPVDFGINVNRAEGTVSIATGAEVPGGLLGVSGGIEIDLNTGEVIGGSIGGEKLEDWESTFQIPKRRTRDRIYAANSRNADRTEYRVWFSSGRTNADTNADTRFRFRFES